jgi:hypothetical protein
VKVATVKAAAAKATTTPAKTLLKEAASAGSLTDFSASYMVV